jgi:KDO2-lipid IV(A) lauroyltransferase
VYQAPPFTLTLLHPRYWLLWLALGIAWLVSWLPYSWLMAIGRGLGRLSFKLLKSRGRIAKRNLELCFPNMSAAERDQLVRRNAEETGCAAIETLIGWWWPTWRVRRIAHFKGYEHIQAELAKGKGVLLLAPHMLHLEAAGRVFGLTHPSVGFYRPHNNALMEFFMYRGRSRSNKYMIGKRDVKALIKALNEGEVCFYLPDQDYGRNRAIFAPLFAVKDTACTSGTLLFAKAANCAVVPIYTSKLPNQQGYQIEALPALQDFPGSDDYEAICRVNQWVEQAILKHPEQYMWVHRRFKTRPDPDAPSLY